MKFGTQNTGQSPEGKQEEQRTGTDRVDTPNQGAGDDSTKGPDQSTAANGPEMTQKRLDESKNLEPVQGQSYSSDVALGGFTPATEQNTGVNLEEGRSDVDRILAQAAAARSTVSEAKFAPNDEVTYSSHPIQNFQIGPWQFENSVLKLNGQQAEEFEKFLATLPLTDRRVVSQLSNENVQSIVDSYRRNANPLGTTQFDSSVGRQNVEALRDQMPVLGTKPVEELNQPALGHAALPQDDGNRDVIVDIGDLK